VEHKCTKSAALKDAALAHRRVLCVWLFNYVCVCECGCVCVWVGGCGCVCRVHLRMYVCVSLDLLVVILQDTFIRHRWYVAAMRVEN